MGIGSKWGAWVKRHAGIDGAVFFTISARLLQVAGSIGTVLLIIHFLSPVEQGYYYTLLSLAALQIVFELGFSFVILQLAAHESALLTFHSDGHIEGDVLAHARLASVLQLTVRWYCRAAIALAVVVLPIGMAFFSGHAHTAVKVSWLGPWVAAVLAISVTFLLTPLYSFLEGCNQVRQVARLRMMQAVVVLAMSWAAIASGHGLYACALVNMGWIAVGVSFLARRRRLLLGLLRIPAGEDGVSWRKEIWPFQWRIAISWLCSYFTLQLFTPILFAFRGPQEAGRMGLTLSIVGYLPIVALCWITTKAAPFGQLIKLGRIDELDALFFRTLKQSLTMVAMLAVGCFAVLAGVELFFPRTAARMESPGIFVLLLLTAVSSFVVQSLAVYLRSFKKEPYLVQSIVVSGITLGAILLAVPRWGNEAVAILYFVASGVVGLLWALVIFLRRTKVKATVRQGNRSRISTMSTCATAVCGYGGSAVEESGADRGVE
jgi:O-antigen/teichoic acid export membrane protein